MSKDKRFVLILDTDGAMLCLGIFTDYRTAIGEAMNSVWDLKDSYRDDGDIFEFDEFETLECGGGAVMTVKFKAACWEKALYRYYYILYAEEPGKD